MCANWVGDNRGDVSPDRNNRYQFDNVGLQIELGLPLQLLGVSLMDNFNNRPRQNGNRGHGGHRRNHYQTYRNKKVEVQQTYDGTPIRKLYVTNISIETQYQEVKHIFGNFGQIMNMYMGVSKSDNSKQFAFISFLDPLDAARVLSLQRFHDMKGRTMYVCAADSWHQPRELPDGTINWQAGRKSNAEKQEESEDDDETSTEEIPSRIETEINEGSLNMLNDDCLLHIFSFLSFKEIAAMERVCKRWQALSSQMWRCLHEIDLKKDGSFKKTLTNTVVLEKHLKRCGSTLKTLDLTTKNHGFSKHTLAIVAHYCTNLEVLRVSNLTVGSRTLAYLGRSCQKLKEIVMEGCQKVTDQELNSFLPKCLELRVLDLTAISGLTGKCFANINGPVTNLRLCELISMEPAHLIAGLKKMSGTLESVTLSACSPTNSSIVKEIVAALPNVTSFSLSRCMMQFDTQSLSHLGQLKKLTSLDLYLNNAVNDTTLSAIVEGCEELTSLNLCGSGGGCAGLLSERGISMLSHLRKLTHLNISYLEATNNMALKNFTIRNSKLKSLICRGCPELNDEGTETVVTLCNELELLDLSGCHKVSNKTAETAVTSVKMRTNNTPLQIIVGGTQIVPGTEFPKPEVPLLTIDYRDLSEDHLRPDFIDEMFFPPSDDDGDDDIEDLNHLCERIGCDCDFDFDDLFDPTLGNDETRMYGNGYLDWMDENSDDEYEPEYRHEWEDFSN